MLLLVALSSHAATHAMQRQIPKLSLSVLTQVHLTLPSGLAVKQRVVLSATASRSFKESDVDILQSRFGLRSSLRQGIVALWKKQDLLMLRLEGAYHAPICAATWDSLPDPADNNCAAILTFMQIVHIQNSWRVPRHVPERVRTRAENVAACIRQQCKRDGVPTGGEMCTNLEARFRSLALRQYGVSPVEYLPDGSLATAKTSAANPSTSASALSSAPGTRDMACNQFSQLPSVSKFGNYADSCPESWCRTVKGAGGFALLLNQLGLAGRAVEVGSYRAQHAGLLLSRWDGIHLSLVDPYAVFTYCTSIVRGLSWVHVHRFLQTLPNRSRSLLALQAEQ